MNFTSGLVVCRSDFRRAVTWRTLARCWLMWSGSDWAGLVCETNGWLWVVDRRTSPIEVRLEIRELVCKPCSDIFFHRWMWRCLRIHSFDRLAIICPCPGLRPKKSSQRLGGLKSLRTPNLSWSVCFNLCKMGLPHWTCYNVGLCSHYNIFACCNCNCFANFLPEACLTCVANLAFFFWFLRVFQLSLSHPWRTLGARVAAAVWTGAKLT